MPESKGGDLGRRVATHVDIHRKKAGQPDFMSIKDAGPRGGIGKLFAHDIDFTLSDVSHHTGDAWTAYQGIGNVGKRGTGKELFLHSVGTVDDPPIHTLHSLGKMQGPSRDPEFLLEAGIGHDDKGNLVHHTLDHDVQRGFGASPEMLHYINQEQHGINFGARGKSGKDFQKFQEVGWRGPYYSESGDLRDRESLKPLDDDCIETASFTSAGPIYKPSNKPGC
jgi:hypothetical protein